MSGSVEIGPTGDGRWALQVNSGKARVFDSLDTAIAQAAEVTFAVGAVPGSWRVLIVGR